jgi:indolepyruvate ferredoxin oxidoreductase beta subunit
LREPFNILIAGVGGQGNLVCGRVLAEAAVRQGLRPVVGDTFGASRRGGSVLTHLRIGTRDWAPLIPRGEVDILLALEPLEALRAAREYAGGNTIAVVSQTRIPVADVSSEVVGYPRLEDLRDALMTLCEEVYMIDTEPFLARIGSRLPLNSFLLGVVSSLPQNPINQTLIRETLLALMGSDSINPAAFDEGAKALQNFNKG